MKITGAELFVKALLAEKVKTLFAYPGGQAIDLFNHRRVQFPDACIVTNLP